MAVARSIDACPVTRFGASFKDDDGYYVTKDGSVAWETHRKWDVDDEEDDE